MRFGKCDSPSSFLRPTQSNEIRNFILYVHSYYLISHYISSRPYKFKQLLVSMYNNEVSECRTKAYKSL